MSNVIDKRSKTANHEQEYAHNYPFEGKSEEYKYSYEDTKIENATEKVQEEVYNVDPQSMQYDLPASKIRVRTTKENILEDHRQQSYKIRTKPQIKTTDVENSSESNDIYREQEVQKIQETAQNTATHIEEDNQKDLTSPNDRYSTFEEEKVEPDCGCDFALEMKVAHVEEGIIGKVNFINDKRLTVTWEDNTRERFSLAEAKEFLSYISDAQTQVSPIQTTPFPKDTQSPVVEKALQALEGDTEEEQTTVAKIDIEKAKLQRKVNDLQNNIESTNIQKIKEKATNEVISLMQKKGMLNDSEEEVTTQFNNIMAMDDLGFETFKNAIVGTQTNKDDIIDEVYAALEDDIDEDIEIEDGNEFAKQREEMKKAASSKRTVDGIEMGDTSFFENGGLAGFKGNIGGFGSDESSTKSTGSASSSSRQTESRSLSSASGERKSVQRTASERRSESNGLDLSGFKDLKGLKAPINIPVKEASVSGKFSELFGSMDWTIISKK